MTTTSPSARPIDTGALAAFVLGTRWPDLPAEVVAETRLLLLDTLGALLGGLRYPPVRRLGALLGTAAAPDETAPFGRLVTLGTAATWLDADSGGSFHPHGSRLPPVPTAHPAPHALPVLLHLAAERDLTDRDVLLTFVLAAEIGMRLGVGTALRSGLHPHGIHGPVAAAAAVARLDGLDVPVTARSLELAAALPIAATLAVPMGGGTVRNVWTGLGSYYGAAAVGRARDGAAVRAELMTRLAGTAVCTDLSHDEVSGALGERWQLRNSYLKPYACARWIHPALDALAVASNGLGAPGAEQIERVEVDTFAFAASLDAVDVRSDLHARFSVPRCVAAFLVDGGRLDADAFLPDRLDREEVVALARRVHLRELPEFSAALPHRRPTRVTVRLADGRVGTAEVANARGNPDAALSVEQIVEKYRRNAGEVAAGGLLDAVQQALTDGDLDGSTVAALARGVLRTMER